MPRTVEQIMQEKLQENPGRFRAFLDVVLEFRSLGDLWNYLLRANSMEYLANEFDLRTPQQLDAAYEEGYREGRDDNDIDDEDADINETHEYQKGYKAGHKEGCSEGKEAANLLDT